MVFRQAATFLGRSLIALLVFWAVLAATLHFAGFPDDDTILSGWIGPDLVPGSISPKTGLRETIPWRPQPVDNSWRRLWSLLGLYDKNAGKGPQDFCWTGPWVGNTPNSGNEGSGPPVPVAQGEVHWNVRTPPGTLEAEGWYYLAPLSSGLRVIHRNCVTSTLLLAPLLAAIATYHFLTKRRYGVFRCPSCHKPLRGLTGVSCPHCKTRLCEALPDSVSTEGVSEELASASSAGRRLAAGLGRAALPLVLAVVVFILGATAFGILTRPLINPPLASLLNPSLTLTDRFVRLVSASLWYGEYMGGHTYTNVFNVMPESLQQIHEACVATIRTSWILLLVLLLYHRLTFQSLIPLAYPHCRKCGYALIALSEPRCPECGEPV